MVTIVKNLGRWTDRMEVPFSVSLSSTSLLLLAIWASFSSVGGALRWFSTFRFVVVYPICLTLPKNVKMLVPGEDDYIDIHTHGRATSPGVFKVKCLLTHQIERPHDYSETAVSVGSHPWFLNEGNLLESLETVVIASSGQNVVAIGETGLDKVKGPDMALQIKAFEKQVDLANRVYKPVIVHCVKAWDELFSVHSNLKPQTPWLIHGFMGSKELAKKLVERGFFISLWYSYALSGRSSELIKLLPTEKLFLETDSSDSDIREIYSKVANDLNITVSGLKSRLLKNYYEFTPSRCKCCVKGC